MGIVPKNFLWIPQIDIAPTVSLRRPPHNQSNMGDTFRSAKEGLRIRNVVLSAEKATLIAANATLAAAAAAAATADVTTVANELHGVVPTQAQMDLFRSTQWRQLITAGFLTMDALWTCAATVTSVQEDTVSLIRIEYRGVLVALQIPLPTFMRWFPLIVLRATPGTLVGARVEVPFRAAIRVEGARMYVDLPALAGEEAIPVKKGEMGDLLIQKIPTVDL
jgi:hypothetical protein